MNRIREELGEEAWKDLIVLLSDFDLPAQTCANKIGGSLVIWERRGPARNIMIENAPDEIRRTIEVGFFITEASRGWRRDNVHFACMVHAGKDIPGDRLLWFRDVWKGKRPPTDYLAALAIYEHAWKLLDELKETDLKPWGPVEGDAER